MNKVEFKNQLEQLKYGIDLRTNVIDIAREEWEEEEEEDEDDQEAFGWEIKHLDHSIARSRSQIASLIRNNIDYITYQELDELRGKYLTFSNGDGISYQYEQLVALKKNQIITIK